MAVLSFAGVVVDASYTASSPGDYWWPLLVVTPGIPALAVAAAATRWRRPAAWVTAVVTTVVAVVLFPFGFGALQVPAAIASWWAVRAR